MKKILFILCALVLTACGGGSTTSGQVEETIAGTMIPARFVGVYNGTVNVRFETSGAISVSDSISEELIVTVFQNGMIRFEVDGEMFTVGLTDAGNFSGNLDAGAFVEECEGILGISGQVDGTTASGTLSGEGECRDGVLSANIDVTGDFSATM